jgi:predicted transglutaminase-like cysteine proteinase
MSELVTESDVAGFFKLTNYPGFAADEIAFCAPNNMRGSPRDRYEMIRTTAVFIYATLLTACGQTSGAGTTMPTAGYAFAPPAFKAFCTKRKSLCSTAGGAKVVELTAPLKAELGRVNSAVNQRIAQRSDISVTGKADEWDLPTDNGDCEDFAIMKKSELAKLGWPRAALLLTVARSGNEGHTVLTVRTSEGDLVLDNRTSTIREWSQTPYRYFARQSQSNGKVWERISGASGP